MAAWDVISTLDSPTSGTFIFTSLDLSAYSILQVKGYGITVTTDGTDPWLRIYVSSSEVTSAIHGRAQQQISSGGSANNDGAGGGTFVRLVSDDANWDVGNAAGEGCAFTLNIDRPASTALYKRAGYETWATGPTGNVVYTFGCANVANAGAIDGIKVAGTSNLTAGKVRLLGLA